MALAPSEVSALATLWDRLTATAVEDERNLQYYRGQQRLRQLGMAIPPTMRQFVVIVNWPRVVVDTIQRRQKLRALVLPGEETVNPQLRAMMDAANMGAQLQMFNRDSLIYGRSFLTVGANEANPEHPLIRVESPRQMAAEVDQRREVVTAAARFYGFSEGSLDPNRATLLLPGRTVHLARQDGRWTETGRSTYRMDDVPVIMHLNRRMTGSWVGESELTDIIPLTDSAARTMTNLQFAVEAHGVPRKWMTGVSKSDFVDANGQPIPAWEAYYDAIHTVARETAKIGQLAAADLGNFDTAMKLYGTQAATLTGFPARYFGLHTTNPPAEGAMRADEAQLVEAVEARNEEVGTTLGWMGALAWQFATGQRVEGNRIRVDWHDPGTPTQAQRMDALTKARSVGVLSREGFWDELGWTEQRKAKERAYFEAEEADPYLTRVAERAAVPAEG